MYGEKKMEETKVEVKDLFMRYMDNNGKKSNLFSAKAIIVLNEHGTEQEIRVPKNENCNISASQIEVLSLLYIESRRI